MITNKHIRDIIIKSISLTLFLIIISCKETQNEKLIKKVKIGQRREVIKNQIGNPDFTYISDMKNIVDTYNNNSQFDAPLVLVYRSNDSILIKKHIDW